MSQFETSEYSSLTYLAQEVRDGSWGAAERFVEALQPQMERMVRNTVRRGTATTYEDKQILDEYRRVCQTMPVVSFQSRGEIVTRVASRLCQSVVRKLQSSRDRLSALETVRG
jgi:hypothetical protein